MQIRIRTSFFVFFALIAVVGTAQGQRAANSNSYYQNLRSLLPGSDVIAVKNLELKRDAATFTLREGNVAFYGDVNGKATGAVFKGEGHLHLTPPTAEERHNLAMMTHGEAFDEDFDQVILRFSDATAAELRKASAGAGQADHSFADAAQQFHNFQRNKLFDNIDLRLLEDVLSPAQGGYFFAAVHGKKSHSLFLTIDPHGVEFVAPEEVALMNWNDWGRAYLTAFYLSGDAAQIAAGKDVENSAYRIDNEELDTTIEKNGFLTGLATVHLTSLVDGLAVVPLTLYPTLRVSKAETEKGDALDFVQEKKDEDADFGVVLAAPLKKGESATVRIAYGGKDVVMDEGGSNYYPVARHSWYPNSASDLGSYTTYHMLFHVPKGLQLIATGTKVNETSDNKMTTTEWKTEVPLAVVGFNLGKFKMKEAELKDQQGNTLTVDAYANTETPDSLKDASGQNGSVIHGRIGMQLLEDADKGGISTSSMLPAELSQGQAAAQIYTSYFGPIPFSKVALTQQFACNYGQSWPMLVYLPICGFLDTTQQNAFGLDPADMYWKVVTPHEVAHQWWGQTVGFHSYRDQWMSEGFADASAAIFLLKTRAKPDEYMQFWKQERKRITDKNAQGFRPIDVGPVTMGFRLNTDKTGENISRDLIYPKGAFILHMIQLMLWSPRDGDARFMAMMHDFVSTYKLKPATTEDFKAMVEKHMIPAMDLEGNHTMDWFFREYVYGTALPAYHFEAQVTPTGDTFSLHYKLVQSGVTDDFKNAVPIYLELADGRVIKMGGVLVTGNSTAEQTIALPRLPSPVKKASLNYYYDVLCTEN